MRKRDLDSCQKFLFHTGNRISAKSAKAFAEALKLNTALTELDLGGSGVVPSFCFQGDASKSADIHELSAIGGKSGESFFFPTRLFFSARPRSSLLQYVSSVL